MIACRVIAALCSLCIAVGCGSATKPDYSELPNDDSESGLVSIAYLKSRCKGLSTTIKSDVSIKGTVVANDLFGEFYKSIVLVDASGGVEVSIDCERLYSEFPLYANVSISCNGLAVGRVGGKVVLGAVPTGEYTVDRIVEDDISKYMLWQRGDVTSAVPRKVTIESFGVEHVSDYVMLEGVRFADDEVGQTWCDSSDDDYLDTERHVVDSSGNVLVVSVSGHCEYAGERIPSGTGTICGILDYSGDQFFLRIANHEVYF